MCATIWITTDVRYVVREHKVKKIEGILGERIYTESIFEKPYGNQFH